MKYTEGEFVIDKPYTERLQTKKKVFKEQTGTQGYFIKILLTLIQPLDFSRPNTRSR